MTITEALAERGWHEAASVYPDDPDRARRFTRDDQHVWGYIDTPADVSNERLLYEIGVRDGELAIADREKAFRADCERRGLVTVILDRNLAAEFLGTPEIA